MQMGFLVEDDVDEYADFIMRYSKFREMNEYQRFVIAPTMNCNFKCTYCFEEKKNKSTMTPELLENVAEFILQKTCNAKEVDVIWYGGEPLCAKEQIITLTDRLLRNSEKYSFVYITNGYEMDNDFVKYMKEHNLKYVQITLDGDKHTHDKRRIKLNGEGTFDKVSENIKKYADQIKIVMRVNIDKASGINIPCLLDWVETEGLKNKVDVVLAPIIDISDQEYKTTYSPEEFATIEIEFYRETLRRGYQMFDLPETKFGFCEALSKNNYLIDADGNFFMCWEELGIHEKTVGSIVQGIDSENELYRFYTGTKDFGAEKCRTCNVLPLCLGGCPRLIYDYKQNKCSSMKYNIADWIKLYYFYRIKGMGND